MASAKVTSSEGPELRLFQKLPFDIKFMIWKAAIKEITENIVTLEEYERFFEKYAPAVQEHEATDGNCPFKPHGGDEIPNGVIFSE